MLRMLFGEPPAKPAGKMGEAVQAMTDYASLLQRLVEEGKDRNHKARTYEIWTLGLIASLDELEQSSYAASRFCAMVKSGSEEEMDPEERLNYRRYVYFDKNAFIRLFALLDKLGTLLNDMLALETEKFRRQFSYFTVLHRMRDKQLHLNLAGPLTELKNKYDEPIDRLRKRRNVEIHSMNSELQDDLLQMHLNFGNEVKLEDINSQMEDLTECVEMAAATVHLVFAYALSLLKPAVSG
jgi:hypothetical protein